MSYFNLEGFQLQKKDSIVLKGTVYQNVIAHKYDLYGTSLYLLEAEGDYKILLWQDNHDTAEPFQLELEFQDYPIVYYSSSNEMCIHRCIKTFRCPISKIKTCIVEDAGFQQTIPFQWIDIEKTILWNKHKV